MHDETDSEVVNPDVFKSNRSRVGTNGSSQLGLGCSLAG
jgi:hypothetical protein